MRGSRRRKYSDSELLNARLIRRDNGCWDVSGHQLHNGYVHVRRVYAHRLAWQLAHGPIPAGQVVCHRCDNPRCANHAHLFLGTQADNIADSVRKGRFTAHHRLGVRLNGHRSRRREHALRNVESVPVVHLSVLGVVS